jgi:hypothetical protein
MSKRQRQRANSRPWTNPTPSEPSIPWDALAADRQMREQQQKGKQQ